MISLYFTVLDLDHVKKGSRREESIPTQGDASKMLWAIIDTSQTI